MAELKPVRVRFAPSPTGYWHPGNARTALFSWLYARSAGGTFVLRIEDTDQGRNTSGAMRDLLETMRWLGLDWDEGPEVGGDYGPYLQSERLPLYRAAAERLLADGKAYYCFTTPEELTAMRDEQRARGIAAPKYDGRYRDYDLDKAKARVEAGEPHVLRVRLPEGASLEWVDRCKGPMSFRSEDFDDFVIVKGDGFPVYNFACVVDDSSMRITTVTRGEDHVPNTPKQIALYRALGIEPPEFCHLPMILNAGRHKLSKRDPGVQSVSAYREQGILASAVTNYFALLGWSSGSEREIFALPELVEVFSLDRVGSSPAVFDPKKLEFLGAEHLKRLSAEEILPFALPFYAELGLCSDPVTEDEKQVLLAAIDLLRTRAWTLRNLAESTVYLFRDDYAMDPDGVRKRLLKHAETPDALEGLAGALAECGAWDLEGVEACFREACERGGWSPGDAIHASRMAVSGSPKGPGVFEVLVAVGRERTVQRLRKTAQAIRSGALQAG
jgi:glutamyl-tRNA synthetase